MSASSSIFFRTLATVFSTAVPILAHAQLAPLAPALPRTHTPQPTTAAITPADLMTRLYIFADDSMQGREVGTIGNVKGTDYIAREVKRMGLVPAGDNGTYFQTIPLAVWLPAPGTSMSIDGVALHNRTDFLAIQGALSNTAIPVIYGGRAGDKGTLTPEQSAGKLVVFSAPSEEAIKTQGFFGYRFGVPNAAGIMYAVLDKMSADERHGFDDPTPFLQSGAGRTLRAAVLVTSGVGDKLFGTPIAQLTAGAVGKTIAVDWKFIQQPAPHPGRNVVAILPGSDPVLKHQYVAIGAHNDHIGMGGSGDDHDSLRVYNHFARINGAESDGAATPAQMDTINTTLAALRKTALAKTPRQDSIYNGADDDGSGSVSVLEIAEYLTSLKNKPKRSILFVWHTGEEKGMWGSGWFVEHPTVPRDSIVTQLNIDMVGRGDASDLKGGSPSYVQLVGSRRLSTELGNIVESVNVAGKHGFTFDYTFDAPGHPEQIYCRSDHWSYARYGIPVTFFTTGGHPDYHQLTDEPQYIDYPHMARVDSLISDIAIHIANLDHRPLVDKPKPDPKGSCVQ